MNILKKAEVKIMTGPAGSGKTRVCYEQLVDAAAERLSEHFYLIVPEQAGSSTEQRLLAVNRERTDRPGFFNLDIFGFSRLAHTVLSDAGVDTGEVLGEYGKTILLRSVMARVKKELNIYQGSVDRRGFVDEIKSLVSEFLLFDISPEELEEAASRLGAEERQLQRKLADVITIYRAFREDPVFTGKYMAAEELQGFFAGFLSEEGEKGSVDGAVFYFDGFTGFTAGQRKVITQLAKRASELHFTITMDNDDSTTGMFVQSREMLQQLMKIAPDAKIILQERPQKAGRLAHLEKHAFRFPVREYKGEEGNDLKVWKAENPLEELRIIAEDIAGGVRVGKCRYRDNVILTPDPAGLQSYLDQVMREYELPYFMDTTRSFTNNPIIDAQLLALEIIDRDFAYEPVFSFLKTSALDAVLAAEGIDPGVVEMLENHVIAHGIRGRKLWGKTVMHFTGRREPGEEETVSLQKMERLRLLFLDILKPLSSFAGEKEVPVNRMLKGLLQLADDTRLMLEEREETAEKELTRYGYLAEARAYRGLTEKFRQVLQKTADILGELPMSIHELRETRLAGAAELHLGAIPPTLDRVLIGDLTRTRTDAVRNVYIINLNEGIFPRPAVSAGIINDRDRLTLDRLINDKELAPGEGRKREEEQFSLYLAMSRAVERLVLSFSASGRSGGEQERSYLLGRIMRLFPGLREEIRVRKGLSGVRIPDRLRYMKLKEELREGRLDPQEEEQFTLLGQSFPELEHLGVRDRQGDEKLPPELMSELKLSISVSGMQKYAGCPYSYFLQYILGLMPRREHDIQEKDVGTILHRALELLFREMKDERKNDWKGISGEELSAMTVEKVRAAAYESELIRKDDMEETSGKAVQVLQQLEELAVVSAQVLKRQLQESSLLPEVMEGSFEAEFTADRPDGSPETVRIRGVIDRLDMFRDEEGTAYLRLLDYKTGDKKLDPRDLRDGRNLQLAIYTKILSEWAAKNAKDAVPAGMYYFHVDRPVLDEMSRAAVEKAGGEEQAALAEIIKTLRLRGLPNIGPLEDEESEKPVHYVLELQEKGAVGEDRSLQTAVSLPITVSSKNHTLSGNPTLLSTDDMIGIGEYGLLKMKQMTEELLKGDIPRYPTRVAGVRVSSCTYCQAAQACLMREDEVRERYISVNQDDKALFRELAEEGNENPVALKNIHMKEHAEPREIEESLEDTDDAEKED